MKGKWADQLTPSDYRKVGVRTPIQLETPEDYVNIFREEKYIWVRGAPKCYLAELSYRKDVGFIRIAKTGILKILYIINFQSYIQLFEPF